MKIKVITPKTASSNTEMQLVELTEYLCKTLGLDSSFGLGGQYGYGVDFENDTFMMKPFCWCEKDECKWCSGEAPNFLYKPTNTKIIWYKWIGRSQEQDGELPKDWLNKCKTSINK